MATDFDTLAADTVVTAGEGTYQCDCGSHEMYVASSYQGRDAVEIGDEIAQMKNLLLHARFDHVSPRNVLKVTHTVVVHGEAI